MLTHCHLLPVEDPPKEELFDDRGDVAEDSAHQLRVRVIPKHLAHGRDDKVVGDALGDSLRQRAMCN